MPLKIGYVVGSLSSSSINRKLAQNLMNLADEDLSFSEIKIGNLPLYNRDQDADYPIEAVRLKEAIRANDGLLIITPEYNRTIPAALKNAFEWGSRPFGHNSFADKPVGVIGASPGAPGTAMAQQHVRNVLAYLNAPVMGQPEGFINFSPARFDEEGIVHDDKTRDFLTNWINAFTQWVIRLHR